MVGRLRRSLAAGAGGTAGDRERDSSPADAAASLAALALEHIPGADPAQWHGLLAPSTTGPLYEGETIPVSPSSIEKLLDSPLDWFLQRMGGSDSGITANVGTIIHSAMETAEDPSVESLWRAIEARWSELLFDAPWLAERQRRIARTLIEALSEYLRDFERESKVLVGAESRFRVELGDAVLSGSIDRVERSPDGSVVIVDLKTGRPETSQPVIDAHPQLAAYQLAYAEGVLDEALAPFGEHRPGGAKLLFVKEGVRGRKYREGVQHALDADELEAFRERVRDASLLIAAAEFQGKRELGGFGRMDNSRLELNRVRAVSSD
jgi:RecB family exonuclease